MDITTANALSTQFFSVQPLVSAVGDGIIAPQARALASATKVAAEENFVLTAGEPATSPALLLFAEDGNIVSLTATGSILDFFV